MESKKINQLATELAPVLSDLTIIGDPTTGISKKITLSQMASLFTGTVEEYPNLASFPLVGTADTIYIALDTNIIYRWNTGTNAYVELSPNIVTSLVFNDANGFDGTISLVGSTATLTITTALTQGSVPFIGTSGALTQDNANLFFDDTNNRLGINTNAPTTALDIFGSGIIGRLNGTSTNNAFLGFASAGSNKWSIGNVQSDHRFRIYNDATTSELVSVLQTGEFGIGIANPTTKLHIDGGASALIANLDANVSVAKSVSFRSDNSNRINLEVSGTESGSNAGANFFIRRYSDAGALIDTPLTITRSTGIILASTTDFNILSITPTLRLTDSAATGNGGNVFLRAEKTGTGYNNLNYVGFQHIFKGGSSESTFLTIDSTGNATFSGILTTPQVKAATSAGLSINANSGTQVADFGAGGSANITFFGGLSGTSATFSGNVGIGATPSAWSDFKVLEFANGIYLGTYTAGGQTLYLGANNYFNGTDYIYKTSAYATRYQQTSGSHQWFISTISGTAGNVASFTQAMTLTNDGNVGIATTSPSGKLDISSGLRNGTTSTLFIGADADISSGTRTNNTRKLGVIATPHYTNANRPVFAIAMDNQVSDNFIHIGGQYSGYNAATIITFATGATNNTETGTERMRIKSNGDVLIKNALRISDDTTWGFSMYKFSTTGSPIIESDGGQALSFGCGGERIRITSLGTLDVRANNNNVNGMSAIISRLGSNCDNTSSYGLIVETGGNNRCFIYGNGNIVNTNNSYGSISDNKLKENISDATEKLSDLLKVKVRNYNFIGDNKKQIGVIAQELEEIFPSMIDETEDFEEVEITDEEGNINTEKQSLGTTTKSVKYSVFVPMLIKAIQEQQAQIDELKALINK
jgi:hypothetical protein